MVRISEIVKSKNVAIEILNIQNQLSRILRNNQKSQSSTSSGSMAFVWIFYNQSASIMNIVQTRRTVTEKTSDSLVDNKAKNHVSRRLSAARRNESYFRPRPSCIQHWYIICRFRTFVSFHVSLLTARSSSNASIERTYQVPRFHPSTQISSKLVSEVILKSRGHVHLNKISAHRKTFASRRSKFYSKKYFE